MPPDPFAEIGYHRLIDWPTRLAREWPFLEAAFAAAPSRRLLDLGCGPGEHAKLLASKGFEVVGIDASPAQLAEARKGGEFEHLRFVEGDMTDVAALVDGVFGGALSVGNTLPSVPDEAVFARLLAGLRHRLLAGAPFVFQILNYDRIFATRQRALPVTVVPDEDSELVFLRLLDPRPDGQVVFTPAMLRYRSDREPPLEILAVHHRHVRGWRLSELSPLLHAAGFDDVRAFGSVTRAPFDPKTSIDLFVVAR
jgi:SAM-dependent methyltransferase